MQQTMEKMELLLAPVAEKLGSNKVLKAISTGFNLIMPIIIIGAIFTLLSSFAIDGYKEFLNTSGLGSALSLVGRFTTDILAIYTSFAISYAFIRNEGMADDAIPAGLLSILAFMLMSPLTKALVGETESIVLTFTYLGSRGLFTAMIVGIVVGYIYKFTIKRGLVIKMPEGVPPTVAKSFGAIVPGFIIVVIFVIINMLFSNFTGLTFSEWLYGIISNPLSALSGSLMTYLVLMFLTSLFWIFGLHGGQITRPFILILFLQAGLDNQAAFAAGEQMSNIITVSFGSLLMLGGIGMTLGLTIDMLLFSKSSQFKTLGKLSILPSICGINEPVMFGAPIVLNPIMAIPFILVPQIVTIITYLVMQFGLVSLPRVGASTFGTPVLLDGWLICGISGIILQVVLIILTALIYYPFFKIQDKIACESEVK